MPVASAQTGQLGSTVRTIPSRFSGIRGDGITDRRLAVQERAVARRPATAVSDGIHQRIQPRPVRCAEHDSYFDGIRRSHGRVAVVANDPVRLETDLLSAPRATEPATDDVRISHCCSWGGCTELSQLCCNGTLPAPGALLAVRCSEQRVLLGALRPPHSHRPSAGEGSFREPGCPRPVHLLSYRCFTARRRERVSLFGEIGIVCQPCRRLRPSSPLLRCCVRALNRREFSREMFACKRLTSHPIRVLSSEEAHAGE